MREATARRKTRETEVEIRVALDGTGDCRIDTGIGFFDHMLDQIGRHGRLDLDVSAKGDVDVDHHHTVEDCGIVLGEAIAAALGDKAGVSRFGYAYAPLDEALARAVVDISGRPSLVFNAEYAREQVGGLDSELFREFFGGVANGGKVTIHVDLIRGVNAHHQVESVFKAFGIALGMAVRPDPRIGGRIPSTKGKI